MTRACAAPIRAATGDAFSDAEIDDILDRLARRHKRIKGKLPQASDQEAWAQAAGEMTREDVETALQAQRLEHFSRQANVDRTARLKALTDAGFSEPEALRAINVGSERQAPGAAASVDAEGRARGVALWGDVERGLGAHEGLTQKLSDFFGRGDDAFDRRVAHEMSRMNGADIEATGDADAQAAATVFNAALEKNRQAQNGLGAFIGRLEGRISRQSHDRLKVAGGFWREFAAAGPSAPLKWGEARLAASRRAFRQWRDYIRPKLDDATFAGIDPEDLGDKAEAEALHAAGVIDDPTDLQERFLYRAWWNIVTGGSETLGGASDLGEFQPPPGKARAVSKHRVLHFASPDDWMDYHGRFGRGSLYSVVMGELERGGKNAALMARWGPSPEAAFDNTTAKLAEAARARGDAGAATALQSRMRRAEFDELTGETNRPENLRLAIVGRSIRTSQVVAKLGGMVLSALSDTSLASQTFARAGGTFMKGYEGAFRGIARLQDADARRAADLMDVGARAASSHLAGRFTATDGPLGWASWAQRIFYKVNGFEAWNDGLRRGVAEMLSAHWGDEAQHGWADLQPGTRETFERYGLDESMWDLVRQQVTPLQDGRRYFSTDALDTIEEHHLARMAGASQKTVAQRAAAVGQMREELRLRFQTMAGGILDDAVTEARAREKVALTRGLKAGTLWGEAVRTFTQFWSFTAGVVGRHIVPAARGYAGRQPVALMAHLIVSSALMGYLSMQAKQLAAGKTPRPLLDENGHPTGAWAAALLQGGGLGLYGDFLFGEYARNGMPATLSSFAGPAVSELERLRLVVGAAAGTLNPFAASTDREQSGHVFEQQGFNLVKNNLPFANIWYTRLALDYLVMWRLQEAISPGYLARYEQNTKAQTGSDFWLHPTSAAP